MRELRRRPDRLRWPASVGGAWQTGGVPATSSPDELRRRPVGVFDSGVGGLTVLHELLVQLPQEDFVYFADAARFPYGDRTVAELEAFALEVAEELIARRIKLLVVACNSATAAALPSLRVALEGRVRVIGVVAPESLLAAGVTRSGEVGLLATPATVASGAYERALATSAPEARLHAVACPELAPLIQAGGEADDRLVDCVEGYCAPLRAAGVDTVILGCTHYPLVAPMLQRTLGRDVRLVTAGHAIAGTVQRVLDERGLASTRTGEGTYGFVCTEDPKAFQELGTRFLQMPLGEVELVEFP